MQFTELSAAQIVKQIQSCQKFLVYRTFSFKKADFSFKN